MSLFHSRLAGRCRRLFMEYIGLVGRDTTSGDGICAHGAELLFDTVMCSIIILRRPGHAWPLLIAANRDEMLDRPWDPPGRHWPDRPEVVAGRDRLAGGSWLGRNDHGVIAAALNREGSLGPSEDKRSRGELVLEALDHADAAAAAEALSAVAPDAYRSFNLVIADNRDAFLVANRARTGLVGCDEIPPGLWMLTSLELNDRSNARIATHRGSRRRTFRIPTRAIGRPGPLFSRAATTTRRRDRAAPSALPPIGASGRSAAR